MKEFHVASLLGKLGYAPLSLSVCVACFTKNLPECPLPSLAPLRLASTILETLSACDYLACSLNRACECCYSFFVPCCTSSVLFHNVLLILSAVAIIKVNVDQIMPLSPSNPSPTSYTLRLYTS